MISGRADGVTRRAFSLIEILLVVAVIAILVGIDALNGRIARDKAGKAVTFHEENTRLNNDAMRGNPEDNPPK